jgi:hypothetical protein
MGERARPATGHVFRKLCRERGGDPRQAAVGAHVSGGARPEALEDDRGDPRLARDPYQDEGGEG